MNWKGISALERAAIELAEAEEKIEKLEAEIRTLGEANKWLTYGIGAWCHKADMALRKLRQAQKTFAEYEESATGMAKKVYHKQEPTLYGEHRAVARTYYIARGVIDKLIREP